MSDDATRTRWSRLLSQWLRHKPENGGLTLSKDGWVSIADVLQAFERAGHPVNRDDFDNIIRLDPKGRYEVERDRVRARYGHSVELEEKPHPGKPPATLYHGTAQRFVAKIMEVGLLPMKRQFVHLSPDRKTAREIGRRRDQEPAIFSVAAHEAHAAGIQFYPRGRGIWLSDPIPPEYLTLLKQSSPSETAATPNPGARRRPRAKLLRRK